MSKLVLDIETIGEDFDKLDEATQENLTRWIRKESADDEEYARALDDLKNGLGFSPLTGEIVAIGVFDCDAKKGAVYYQAPGKRIEDAEEDGISFKMLDERDMLRKFWEVAKSYDTFITFNGRSFDAPFLMIRSAIRGVRPTKDLMRNRYINNNAPDAIHVDLLDQLTFYGAVRRKGGLHLWARAFGIPSPKASGTTGDDVGPLFKEGKFLEIAKYNALDLRATAELYSRWESYLRF